MIQKIPQTGSSQEDKKISEVTEISRFRENITVEEIAECELEWFKGEIVLVDDIKTFYEVFPRLLGYELLGFDTETKPTFKKGKKENGRRFRTREYRGS